MPVSYDFGQIVTSRWWTDAYKASMGYIFASHLSFINLGARYKFNDRIKQSLPKGFLAEFKRQLTYLQYLPPEYHIADYMAEQWSFIPKWYWRWYADLKFDMNQVHVEGTDENPVIWFEAPAGKYGLAEVTHWELHALHIYTVLLNKMLGRTPKQNWEVEAHARGKLFKDNGVVWSLMAGRRPFSNDVLRIATGIACEYAQDHPDGGGLSGISNMYMAYIHGKRPMGSVAHEFPQICAALFGYGNANRMAMQIWYEVYGTHLGYALTDTFSTHAFLQDLSFFYASKFKAFRNDSMDPFMYVNTMLEHLQHIGLSASGLLIVHTNFKIGEESLIVSASKYRTGEYLPRFGMGQIWDNNCGWPGANNVCKNEAVLFEDGTSRYTVKISDTPGKESGDPEEVRKCKTSLGIRR